MSELPSCQAKRASGQPCRVVGAAVKNGFCGVHSPEAVLANEQRIQDEYNRHVAFIRAEKERLELQSLLRLKQEQERRAERERLEALERQDAAVQIQLRAECSKSMMLASELLHKPDASPADTERAKALLELVRQTRLLKVEEMSDDDRPLRVTNGRELV